MPSIGASGNGSPRSGNPANLLMPSIGCIKIEFFKVRAPSQPPPPLGGIRKQFFQVCEPGQRPFPLHTCKMVLLNSSWPAFTCFSWEEKGHIPY
jgi:hypothetical protein